MWNNDAAGRAGTLRVQNTMPGSIVIGAVHDKADRSGRITVAENFRKLSVRHYFAAGNLTDYPVDTFSIIGVGRSRHWFALLVYLRLRSTARAGAPSPLPSAIFSGKQINS